MKAETFIIPDLSPAEFRTILLSHGWFDLPPFKTDVDKLTLEFPCDTPAGRERIKLAANELIVSRGRRLFLVDRIGDAYSTRQAVAGQRNVLRGLLQGEGRTDPPRALHDGHLTGGDYIRGIVLGCRFSVLTSAGAGIASNSNQE